MENEVRKRFSELFEKNKKIEDIYRRIRIGTADFNDASDFAKEVGNILVETFGYVLPESLTEADIIDLADNIVGNAMRQNVRLTDLVCGSVQSTLNEMSDVGLAPVVPEINASRIAGIQTQILDADSSDKIKVILGEPLITHAMSVVDDWVQTNAEFQAKAGMSPVIVRRWSGAWPSHDTKHTDWCKSLEGTYNYYNSGSVDPRVFSRHTGCRCTVAYYPSNKAKGRITALRKGEKDTDEVLWNTGNVYSNSRKATLERRRRQYGKEEARKILNEEWKGGRNGLAERHFS